MNQKKGLKIRQDILEFIEEFTREHGYSPSVREISKHTCVGVSTVQYHLDVLEGHGYISRQENTSRSVRLLNATESYTNLSKLCNAVNAAIHGQAKRIDALAELLTEYQQGQVLSVSEWRTVLEGSTQTPVLPK